MKLRFRARAAGAARAQTWHPAQQVQDAGDGELIWQARVAEPRAWLPWILSWGADCEALEPVALREAVAAEARALAQRYGWFVSSLPGVPSSLMEDILGE